jgi:hypothetical protein
LQAAIGRCRAQSAVAGRNRPLQGAIGRCRAQSAVQVAGRNRPLQGAIAPLRDAIGRCRAQSRRCGTQSAVAGRNRAVAGRNRAALQVAPLIVRCNRRAGHRRRQVRRGGLERGRPGGVSDWGRSRLQLGWAIRASIRVRNPSPQSESTIRVRNPDSARGVTRTRARGAVPSPRSGAGPSESEVVHPWSRCTVRWSLSARGHRRLGGPGSAPAHSTLRAALSAAAVPGNFTGNCLIDCLISALFPA